jgi:hypothetical protein
VTRVQIGPGVESKPTAVDKLHDTLIESSPRMGEGMRVRCEEHRTAASASESFYFQTLDSICAGAPANPSLSARASRCLTDEECHRVPPRGVRSCMASS